MLIPSNRVVWGPCTAMPNPPASVIVPRFWLPASSSIAHDAGVSRRFRMVMDIDELRQEVAYVPQKRYHRSVPGLIGQWHRRRGHHIRCNAVHHARGLGALFRHHAPRRGPVLGSGGASGGTKKWQSGWTLKRSSYCSLL